ncbi:hypothetical protein [Amycolatopsis taiwanensis]|uniref:hypothetical protein n=1 Tax=Amycolatopsis taiwanensis TaxID=342230 RepID=UPI0004B61C62|nr:hypothetical protein [Amycolatopsis taiwanensis]
MRRLPGSRPIASPHAIARGDQDTARTLFTAHLERTRDVRVAALVQAGTEY